MISNPQIRESASCASPADARGIVPGPEITEENPVLKPSDPEQG